MLLSSAASVQQPQLPSGAIRGTVSDKDFDIPLAAATVLIVETNQQARTSDQGHFVLEQVPAGKYTLLFTKDGYVRQVRSDVVVSAGQLTEVSVALAGEFTEMDELVVQDILQGGAGAEAALLTLRLESAALMDSISSELMSRAGASDAAAAVTLVAGVTVEEGKFAVVRGLPDRYVSSQMNGVRLPSADEDTRAVELDQFPAPIIDNIQVSKTFTPDQQGDASGGAVDVRLKGIPADPILQAKLQYSVNSNVAGSDFLTYDGGGVSTWGDDDGDRDIPLDLLGESWKGAAGTKTDDPPLDFKFNAAYGGKHESDDGFKFGGLASFFYERDSAFYDDGVNDSWWMDTASNPVLTPETNQGVPDPSGEGGTFKTALFDITQGQEIVTWGGLGTLGLETRDHTINLTGLYTRDAQDTATLAVDTRGKEFFFPGHDPDDPNSPGHYSTNNLFAAPYLRLETLEYVERTTATLQLNGTHKLPIDEFKLGELAFKKPELDWTASRSFAGMYQPDKRFFSSYWTPEAPGTPATWWAYQPTQFFTLGNFQRVWKEIAEDSEQYSVNLKFPFQQWSDREGYVKLGLFDDFVTRSYDQESFSNFADPIGSFQGDFDEPWSDVFPTEDHDISASETDIDYDAEQEIAAWYAMIDLPLSAHWNVITGLRFESTDIGIVNHPEAAAEWLPSGATSPVGLDGDEADVDFAQDDVLPSIGLVYEVTEQVTLRGAYGETIARQTFKELTPALQQEYLGAPIFVGNPDLQMSDLQNYDLRADYTPYDGGLVSLSGFYKDIKDPIEYVQKPASFIYTTPENYPKGTLYGAELEVRQRLEKFSESLEGLSVGANATLIESEVDLPQDEIDAFSNFFAGSGLSVPSSRDMTNAPEYLYNIYLTYDLLPTNTQFGLFYTYTGDALVAGGGVVGNFVPDVYAKGYDTLNLTVSQRFGRHVKLDFQAKNLTNPEIEEVYRSDVIDGDKTRQSYTRGIELSLALGVEFSF